MCFIDPGEREGIRDQIRDGKADPFRSLQEIERCDIITQCVDPASYQIDFLCTQVKMRIDRRFPVVDKEAQLTETAAVPDEVVDVGMSRR